ncbi:MAG: DUF4037 domain-containing protein [Anaerolineaceae bacterium]|nr:DUF4037 domain-containing protein [Anaerolineaceae bacterium]
MPDIHQQIAAIAARFSQLPEVEAVAVGGSQAAGTANAQSDTDIYVYTHSDLSRDTRYAIGREFADEVQLIDYWGPGMEWVDRETGMHMDIVFFGADWMADQLERVLTRHEASLGYTTCFWHTLRVSRLVYDRGGWLARLYERAQSPYPDALVKAIVNLNSPPLRAIFPSYRTQIAKAARRDDLVSLNHRTAALLASYFDILFAINRQTHPGEKRLLATAEQICPNRPPHMRAHITALLAAAVNQPGEAARCVDALVDELEPLVEGVL